MSKAPSISPTDGPPEQPDPEDLIEEHRELLERIAAADLSISDRIQAALDEADREGESDV